MVYLIGAGPGDAGLLTVKAKEILETAEVVIYDKLANEKILEYAPPDSEKIYVGKAAGYHTLKQSEINKLLVEKGAEKKIVVRLKGGDPFVFGFAWEYRKPDKAINVKFNGNAYMKEQPDGSLKLVHEDAMIVMAVPYDVPIVGYHNKTVNTLRLWNAEVNRDFSDYGMLTHEQMRAKNDYRNFVESITQYLYPDDSSNDGKRMRLIQEYFMVSAGVQSIVRHFVRSGGNIREFDKKIAIHINDTHPALCVAELMRLFVDEYGLEWNEAWTITRATVAYTNHTIMPEALETWPVDMFRALLPRIYMIIDEINRRHCEYVKARYPGNVGKLRAMSIIENGLVHMARLSVVGSHSVNGVARIHSDILKSTTLHDFYEYWPRMFNNKTNGITHRRWLMGANPELAALIDKTIG